MIETFIRWLIRKWSDWEYVEDVNVYQSEYGKRPVATYSIFKSTSNDGLVKYKRVKK